MASKALSVLVAALFTPVLYLLIRGKFMGGEVFENHQYKFLYVIVPVTILLSLTALALALGVAGGIWALLSRTLRVGFPAVFALVLLVGGWLSGFAFVIVSGGSILGAVGVGLLSMLASALWGAPVAGVLVLLGACHLRSVKSSCPYSTPSEP